MGHSIKDIRMTNYTNELLALTVDIEGLEKEVKQLREGKKELSDSLEAFQRENYRLNEKIGELNQKNNNLLSHYNRLVKERDYYVELMDEANFWQKLKFLFTGYLEDKNGKKLYGTD